MKDKLVTCLWFDTEGEDAARFYTSVFPSSKLGEITRYGTAAPREEGAVMTVGFELMGQEFVALNGGPQYTFNEAVSFQVLCDDHEEARDRGIGARGRLAAERQDRDSFADACSVGERKGLLVRRLAPEALAGSEHDREDHQP
jgi:hypothetical protein